MCLQQFLFHAEYVSLHTVPLKNIRKYLKHSLKTFEDDVFSLSGGLIVNMNYLIK